ncbi:Arc family DNA-binding protein [Pseudomonas typographi]|uniref:Arc family DNA-binding protein n=1 Tax=Pseudomonas typographi TaxID=2715964 RepID=UPI001687D0AA|nr:Arc family DNA-binding protein [Pseudomonas typographi]MBD1590179.1 Arc family DNA-binding protein [Pseudomonas typographi]
MSREDSQFKLRMPPELREKIEESAKLAKRSLNAEIVARLEESQFRTGKPTELPQASKAREMAAVSRRKMAAAIRSEILSALQYAISQGLSEAPVNLGGFSLDELNEHEFEDVFLEIYPELTAAGYGYEWDKRHTLHIDFSSPE